jgi:aerobic carbon-monoxide dehydrogenase small subunit
MMTTEKVDLTLNVNGQERHLADVWYFESLLNVLRYHLGLTGTKYSCDTGQCGACTVQVDGRAVNSCIELAAVAEGTRIRTIEGYCSADGTLSELQNALVAGRDLQCGYCIPGVVMSGDALLAEYAERDEQPTEDDVRMAMSGNQCRCTGYDKIVQAVLDTARRTP